MQILTGLFLRPLGAIGFDMLMSLIDPLWGDLIMNKTIQPFSATSLVGR
jgi:hypothetical protein